MNTRESRKFGQKRRIGHYSGFAAVFIMLFMQFSVIMMPNIAAKNDALMNCPMHAMMAGKMPLTGNQKSAGKICSYCTVRNSSALEQAGILLERNIITVAFHTEMPSIEVFYGVTESKDNQTRGPPHIS